MNSAKMTFFNSLFCCYTSRSLSEKAEAETRRIRIINAVNASEPYLNSHEYTGSRPQSPRYRDNPPLYTDIAKTPLITIDEKIAADFDRSEAREEDDEDDDTAAPPISPNSSVISIPSTRLTDLTAMPTGGTASSYGRSSLERWTSRSTRPPSYDGTRAMTRTPSPNPLDVGERLDRRGSPPQQHAEGAERNRADIWVHPVMQNDWLQVLQADAAGTRYPARRRSDR